MRLPHAAPLLTALALALPSPARAAPTPEPQAGAAETPPGKPRDEPPRARIVLVRPVETDPITTEALFRIQGELTAEGFNVVLVDASTTDAGFPVDADPALATPVTITLSLDPVTHVAELLVVRSRKRARWIDTRGAPPEHLAEVLAVRAVELVRASLVEIAPPVARPLPVAPAPAAKLSDPTWAIEAGPSVMVSPGGVGPAALALARIRFAPHPRLELRAAFVGLGTLPRVPGPDGASARVSQILALAEVTLRPWPDLRVRPSFSLSGGALEVSTEGEALSPYRGKDVTTWSGLVGGGAGAEVLVGPHFGVAMEARAFAAIPYPSVRFLGEDATRVAAPGLLGSITMVAWL